MTTETKPSPFSRLRNFILEIQAEMLKVTWPTKEDLQVSTRVVVILLLAMAVFTYVTDRVLTLLVYGLLSLSSK